MDGTLCSNKQKTNSLQRAAFMDGSAHGIKAARSSGKLEKTEQSELQPARGVLRAEMSFVNATQNI